VEALKSGWNQFEQDRVVVVLDQRSGEDGTWGGGLMTDRGLLRVTYSAREGLVVMKA
jgi:hypothetical protein